MPRISAPIRRSILVAGGILLLNACAESERPDPTGEAFFRGINAIPTAPSMNFKIEERNLESLDYKQSSPAQRFDDFAYTFNFDYAPVGGGDEVRFASTFIDTLADQDYVAVLAGTFSAPEVFLWERADRIWDGTETIFQIDVGHVSLSTGEVDVYLDLVGTAPVLGSAVATLSYGDFLPPIELAADDYVITLTARDDPADVILQTDTIVLPAAQTFTGILFDADPNITGPAAFRLVNATGAVSELPDINSPPTVRFLHAALGEVAIDISINGDTANPIASNVSFGEVTADLAIPFGDVDLTYTEAGNPGVILLEQTVGFIAGTRSTSLINGTPGALAVTTLLDQRRRRATNAIFRIANMSTNQTGVDLYLVEPGTDINNDDVAPGLFNIVYPLNSATLRIAAGSYEIWLTVTNDKSMPLAGPVPLDFANGDTVAFTILDNVDPAIVDLLEYQR
ncbi:MAG: DUF4397 domain-containing protein [Gammaproteobacteria bacterium]|nr:DUF4397 domain-containing protein [Gammaproteobacteria bacterium]